jgi:hypothetical protein
MCAAVARSAPVCVTHRPPPPHPTPRPRQGIKGRGEYVRLCFEDAGVPYVDAGQQQGARVQGCRPQRQRGGGEWLLIGLSHAVWPTAGMHPPSRHTQPRTP